MDVNHHKSSSWELVPGSWTDLSTSAAKLGPSGGSPADPSGWQPRSVCLRRGRAHCRKRPTQGASTREQAPGAEPWSSCPPPASPGPLAPLGLFISTHSHALGCDDHLDSHDGGPLRAPTVARLPSPTPITVPAHPEHLASPSPRPQDGVHTFARLHAGTSPLAPGMVEPTSRFTAAPSRWRARACFRSSACPPCRARHARPGHTVAVPSLLHTCRPRQTPLPACSNSRTRLQPPSLGRLSRTRPSPRTGMACFLPKRRPRSTTSAHGRLPNCQHHQPAFLRLRAGVCASCLGPRTPAGMNKHFSCEPASDRTKRSSAGLLYHWP